MSPSMSTSSNGKSKDAKINTLLLLPSSFHQTFINSERASSLYRTTMIDFYKVFDCDVSSSIKSLAILYAFGHAKL